MQGAARQTTLTLGLLICLALCAVCGSQRLAAQLSVLETDSLRLVYFDPSLTYLAPHAARCFESSLRFQAEQAGFTPSEKITVLLKDFSDWGNAAAGAVPRDQLQFDVAPMDFTFESFVAPERMYMLMNHELVHVATMDRAAPADRTFRRLFGGKVRPIAEHPESMLYQYLTTPRAAVPRWYNEGFAVFGETWMAGGVGRAQGSYDEMVFRAMVRDGSHFYDPLGLVSEGVKTSFQVEANSYLYGTRFLSYLAYHHSPEHLLRWVYRDEGSKRHYAAEFRRVFGLSLEEAWSDWVDWERGFQEANLERIREFPVTPSRDLSDRALGSVSRAHLDPDGKTLYLAFNYPGVVAHVGAISLEDGTLTRILEVKRPSGYGVTSLAFDADSRTLFYTTDNKALRDLRAIDLATGRARTLIEDLRTGDLVFDRSDRSLWGLRHLNGIATLVRVPHPYERWEQVRSWPYGEIPFALDVSADGGLVSASVAEISGEFFLRVWRREDLLEGSVEPLAERQMGSAIPLDFAFSPDGRHLYGSSYMTGVSNIFRFEPATGALEAMTNADGGFFRPIPLGEDSLLVFRYTGEGFVPARIDGVRPLEDVNAIVFLGNETIRKHPQLADWRVGSPAKVDLDALVTGEGEYRAPRNVGLESVYPVVEGYKSTAAYGLRVNLSDHFALLQGDVAATWSPDDELPSDERLHVELGLRHKNWRASATLNDADFYDLFGPTKTSRKGYSLGVGYDRLLIWDEPREMELTLDLRFYGDLERLPEFQNVAATFDELLTAKARLHYQNLRSSLGAVDDEKGFAWEVVAKANHVNGETIPSLRAGYDVGVPLPLRHSSVWLRTAAGGAFGDLGDPFASFFFGGFGNNYVDHAAIQRYREHYAFPGLELNEVGGRTFVRALVDWNLPPVHFRRAGGKSLYLTWARTSIFAAGLVTDPEETALRATSRGAGVQIDFRFVLMSNLDLTLSLGWASARAGDGRTGDELLASLKIL